MEDRLKQTRVEPLKCPGVEGDHCGKPAKRVRQNTAYTDEDLNWVVACPECLKVINELWDEQWADYYRFI